MQVIEWLIANNMDWDKLKEEFGIKTTHYPEHDLHVLNYSQIDSPKMHPIVRECRGLILDYDLNIVARPFDRFFNRGEADTSQFEQLLLVWYPKMDGSFIKVYMHQGIWYMGTRGTAFAESEVNGFGLSFYQLGLKAFGLESFEEFQKMCRDAHLIPHVTYMFELTAVENRVVTRYEKPRMSALAARDCTTGDYLPSAHLKRLEPFCDVLEGLHGTPEVMAIRAGHLKNLEEGFVGYYNGAPVMKIKSDAYVAVHHLRGEGLNPKRISELVATGEQDEYLTYFPEDRPVIQPYAEAEALMILEAEAAYMKHAMIENQKEFAMAVKDLPHHDLMFMARRNGTSVGDIYLTMPLNSRANRIKEETLKNRKD